MFKSKEELKQVFNSVITSNKELEDYTKESKLRTHKTMKIDFLLPIVNLVLNHLYGNLIHLMPVQ